MKNKNNNNKHRYKIIIKYKGCSSDTVELIKTLKEAESYKCLIDETVFTFRIIDTVTNKDIYEYDCFINKEYR